MVDECIDQRSKFEGCWAMFYCILRVMGSFNQPPHHALRVAFAVLSILLQIVWSHRSEIYRGLINEAKNLYKTNHYIREGDLYNTA